MIGKLKRRFIVLAMTSLVVLMTVIVAGMNIVNYQKVVSDADTRLEVLEENKDRLLTRPGGGDRLSPFGGPGDMDDDFYDMDDDLDDMDEFFFGRGGRGGPSMSQDEAEESRFFTVTINESGGICESNINRISSVDSDEAVEYAQKALASGKENGFVEDFRYDIDEEDGNTVVTFLDCGRVLESFKDFLKYSILISLIGLAIMFGIITYFAGRIVRPVAESYEKQKRFITDAGHEIKTPLAIIKANIDVLNMDIETGVEGSLEGKDVMTSAVISEKSADELRDSLGDINDQVDRLTSLTNDLVYLSRMEEGGNAMVMMDVSFSDIVNDTAGSFVPLADEKGKAIIIDAEPGIDVRGNPKELEKLVSILMENAIKYSLEPRRIELGELEDGMPAPPEISVDLRRDGRNAVLELRNETNEEVSNESLSHVFERFYRMDASRNSETGGHGIGLSMASAIVSAHGGKISARTTTGHNFIVTASIPLS